MDCGIDLMAISDFPSGLVASSSSTGRFSKPFAATRPRTSGRTAPRSAATSIVVANADRDLDFLALDSEQRSPSAR